MRTLQMMALAGMMMVSLAGCDAFQKVEDKPADVVILDTDNVDETEVIVGEDERTWGPELESETEDITGENNDYITGMPNPIIEYDTAEEAANAAGFTFSVPEQLEGMTTKIISVIDTDPKIYQVLYETDGWNGADEYASVLVRKAVHSEGMSDISGVYNIYENTHILAGEEKTITLKGSGDSFEVALWVQDGYDYSVYADNGMEQTEMLELIEQLQ